MFEDLYNSHNVFLSLDITLHCIGPFILAQIRVRFHTKLLARFGMALARRGLDGNSVRSVDVHLA